MAREIIVKGKLEHHVTIMGRDGVTYTKLLLVGGDGDALADSLKSTSILVDTASTIKTVAKAPAAVKNDAGELPHSYLGVSQKAPVVEAATPVVEAPKKIIALGPK